MFALAWLLLPDLPHYRTGLILIGLARCIAMVLIWNMLARGSGEVAAVLVALNSVFQILFYSVLGWLFLAVVPRWFGGARARRSHLACGRSRRASRIFLGIPLLAGALTRVVLRAVAAAGVVREALPAAPRPDRALGLLYTIVLMFAMQGDKIVGAAARRGAHRDPAARSISPSCSDPAFFSRRRLGFYLRGDRVLSFTAAGNNFELAIAVAVGIFGIASGEALAVSSARSSRCRRCSRLVYVALWARARFFSAQNDISLTPLLEEAINV